MSANNPKQPAEPAQSDREAAHRLRDCYASELGWKLPSVHALERAFANHRRDHVRKALEDAAKWTTDGYRCRSCGTVFLSEDGNRCCDRPNWDKLTEDQVAAAIRSMKQEVK